MKESTFDKKSISILSTGNTGAEIGALAAAQKVGLQTGGDALKGWLTEVGAQQEILSGYGLIESKYVKGEKLTEVLVKKANATIIFLQFYHMPECLNAMVSCDDFRKPLLIINPYRDDAPEEIARFLEKHQPQKVFVTGNREGKTPGMAKQVFELVKSAFGEEEGVGEEPSEPVEAEAEALES